jgi:hypothetical protein
MIGVGFFILAKGRGEGIIPGYYGGTSSIVIIIIVATILAYLLALLIYLGFRVWKKHCFEKFLCQKEFEKKEISLFKSYTQRLNVYDAKPILLEKNTFNQFVNSIALLHEASNVPYQNSIEESAIFTHLRRKLSFESDFNSNTVLTTTRSLPEGIPLSLSWVNPLTQHSEYYYTNLILNSELFIGVSIPEEEQTIELFQRERKLELDLSFSRKSDAQYFCFTHVVSVIFQPIPMLLIAHSEQLKRTSLLYPLGIPGKLMYTFIDENGLESLMEYEISIGSVNAQGIVFLEKSIASFSLKRDSTVVAKFNLDDNELSCRGYVSEIIEAKTGHIIRIIFTDLEKEKSQLLLQFKVKQHELSQRLGSVKENNCKGKS